MNSEAIGGITVRALRRGEAGAVQSVFDALGPQSRLQRFGGAKNLLSTADLAALTRVDANHHVLVALLKGAPVGIARLVRAGATAEIAVAIGDAWQGRGVGTVLIERLAADARAAGITEFRATVQGENRASLALMRRVTRDLRTRCSAGQQVITGRAA